MPSYSHNYVTINLESSICNIEYTGGVDKNYVLTNYPILALTKITQSGVDITSEASIEFLSGIGNVITFGNPSTKLGLVLITYTSSSVSVPIEQEAKTITRYNVGGTHANFISLKSYPVKESSVIILNGDGDDVTSYLQEITGEGLQTLLVGNLTPGKHQVTYDYDNGQPGFLYRDNLKLSNDITDLTDYIEENNTKYQVSVSESFNSKEISKKNYRLWLMRKIIQSLPSTTGEDLALADLFSYWESIRGSIVNESDYNTLNSKVETLKTLLETNGNPENFIITNSNTTPKVFTYISKLSKLDNQLATYSFSTGMRYDYDGTSNGTSLSAGSLGKFTNGLVTESASYSESVDYSLSLNLNASLYVVGLKITVVPSDNVGNIIDNFIVHLGENSLLPANFNDNSNTDKQVNNQSLKNAISQDISRFPLTVFISETLKDSTGSPVSKDLNYNKFDHEVTLIRKSLYIFKKSTNSSNYIANIELYVPSSDIVEILDFLQSDILLNSRLRVYRKLVSFLTDWDNEGSRIGAWRGSNSKGVSTSGNTGHVDGSTYYDTDHLGSGASTAWGHVRDSINLYIDTNFAFGGSIDSIISSWESELSGESISSDTKTVDLNLSIWNKKYSEEFQKYLSAYNSKNTKTVTLIQNKQVLTAYGTLPSIN